MLREIVVMIVGDYNKMEVDQNFEVLISKELEDKINWFVNNYENEIGAWLIGEITNEKIIIKDILVPNQEVSGGSVDTSGKALVQLRKEYGDKCKEIIGHWHSHNTMGADWSSIDDDFMKEFTAPRERAVFIVSSQEDKHRIKLVLTKPFKISFDELNYKLLYEDSKMGDELNKIIKEKCKERKSSYSNDWSKEDTTPEIATEELTKKEINKMIIFCKKTNNVYVKDLTLYQYYQIENVFPIKTESFNSEKGRVTMRYKTKTKKRAIELMKNLKEFMKEEFKEKEDLESFTDFEGSMNGSSNYHNQNGNYEGYH